MDCTCPPIRCRRRSAAMPTSDAVLDGFFTLPLNAMIFMITTAQLILLLYKFNRFLTGENVLILWANWTELPQTSAYNRTKFLKRNVSNITDG
ncbi:conserved hypothetical protein [Agrobacterium sp. NCPPB 925]|nr:conserved hypothetical protein [Agrobacterium sp. NCPPB 925]